MPRQSAPALLLDPTFPYGEDLFQFIWQQGLFDHHALRTTDGRTVEVVKAGRIQVDSGPDLMDAQVRIDGQLWAGTVEVHLRSSDWNTHGHERDPAYDSVVLHVVFEHDAEVRMRNGASPPTVELHSRVSSDSISLYRSLMRGQGFVPCASQIAHVDKARIGPWLERVLVERLQRKAREVEALYDKLDLDPAETLYHMIARAFGLKVNAEPFGMLAHALPLKIIQKYRDDALRTEALLFGQAGLLQVDFVEAYPRELQREHALLARLHGLHPAPVAAWKFNRMRPLNFPTVRIAQFAQLLMRCDGDLGVLLSTDNVKELFDRLNAEASAYWMTHYRFDSQNAARPKRLGRAGAQHLIINAIVPVLFALGRAQGREEMGERALRLLEQLPAERNQLLASWAHAGLVADTAARGQALVELKNLYCAQRRCLSCAIGNQLLRSTVK